MPERLRQNATFKSKASVAPWADVAKLMRADGRTDEAAQVEAAIGRFNSFEAQTRAVRRLPFYRGLIDTKYLPRLRRVGYEMHYAIYRELTIDEIRQLYNDDYKQLSRFEFFTLYRSVADEAEREKILRQAIEVYPKFMVAANDLAAILINRHQSDPDLLRPFAGDRAPQEVNVNQMIALLDAGLYHDADSVAEFVENNEQTRTLHAVNAVLNGRYDDNFAVIANTGTRNELLMLLAMKRNEEALKLSKQLDTDEALSHYLRAICLNRTENPSEAYDELKKSFEMDPKLREMAPLDGDVNDLLDLEKKN